MCLDVFVFNCASFSYNFFSKGFFNFGFLHLSIDKGFIISIKSDKFIMRTLFNDLSILEYDDVVSTTNSTESMSDYHDSLTTLFH